MYAEAYVSVYKLYTNLKHFCTASPPKASMSQMAPSYSFPISVPSLSLFSGPAKVTTVLGFFKKHGSVLLSDNSLSWKHIMASLSTVLRAA